MNLINTDIKPDPFDPHRGDVYESGGPFPQRIVVEIPPTSEDQRIRYRVDGGVDSNLTTLGQFHLHLAGLGEIRGVGRVREYSPVSPDEIRSLVHRLRSDLAIELDSISAFVAPHGVTRSSGATKPTSLELVRWLAVTGGVIPRACHPTLAEVQEAQEVDFRARWDRYESAKRNPDIGEPARPEVGEVDHFPSVAETRALGLRAEVHRTVAQLREISVASPWPIRERLQSAAAVMLEVSGASWALKALNRQSMPSGA